MNRPLARLLSAVLLPLVPLLSACDAQVTLDQIHPLHVNVDSLGIALLHDTGACPVIPTDAEATVNGVKVPLADRGGSHQSFLIFIPSCSAAQFTPVPSSIDWNGPREVVVKDSTRTVRMMLGRRDPMAFMRLVAPASGELVVGQRATLTWPDPEDHLVAEEVHVSLVSAAPTSSTSVDLTGADLDISGANISFTVPDLPDGELFISVIAPSANVLSCEGAERCTDTDAQNGSLDFNAAKPMLRH